MNTNMTSLFMDMAIDRALAADEQRFAKKELLNRISRSIRRQKRGTKKGVRRG